MGQGGVLKHTLLATPFQLPPAPVLIHCQAAFAAWLFFSEAGGFIIVP